ncbi:hypothetical protein T10_12109 [Trichinella papuae]|uniref:Uncharacterized protein n=1 Tax=Trichinella papuae TaxID=268474 RepID=A0A0V1MDT0_9BILA|nr:hypothetical protein T10_12109 [Trichinella papuae]
MKKKTLKFQHLNIKKRNSTNNVQIFEMQSNLVKCTWNLARISMHLFKLCTYPKLGIMQTLLGDLQFGLSLSDLCCFRENMTKLSLDLRQLPCE